MKKLEELINVATSTRRNVIISTGSLLLIGYIMGFLMIKVGSLV